MNKEKLLDKHGNHIAWITSGRLDDGKNYWYETEGLIDGFKSTIPADCLELRLNVFGLEKYCTDSSHFVLINEEF